MWLILRKDLHFCTLVCLLFIFNVFKFFGQHFLTCAITSPTDKLFKFNLRTTQVVYLLELGIVYQSKDIFLFNMKVWDFDTFSPQRGLHLRVNWHNFTNCHCHQFLLLWIWKIYCCILAKLLTYYCKILSKVVLSYFEVGINILNCASPVEIRYLFSVFIVIVVG